MLHVEDLDGDLDMPALVIGHRSSRIANSGLHIGYGAGNSRDHAGAVFGYGEEFDGIRSLLRPARPFDFDNALPVHHQLFDILAACGMDRHAFTSRDVTDDVFPVQWIAATSARDH